MTAIHFIPVLYISLYSVFNVQGSVHCKNILLYVEQDANLYSLFYLETALHVSGSTSTHHQERKQLYLQHLVFVTPLLLPAAIVEELELQSSSISFTIAADSSNGVTNTRCCRYSSLRS
jgi:hypothetical protein